MYFINVLFVQAPKPPSETSERRLSRDKGPAPPPPPMRQDSEEKKKKEEEKENIMNSTDKQKFMEDKAQINKLSQNEKTMNQQVTNIKEQKNLEIENQTRNELDSENMKRTESEDSAKLLDNIKRFENQQKLINNKSNPPAKKQLGINEKRKSAPVKPEMIEDLSKIIYKQSSLKNKDGYVFILQFSFFFFFLN